MDNWEYAALRASGAGNAMTVTLIKGPHYQNEPIQFDDPTGALDLRALDVLGADGWEVMHIEDNDSWTQIWLKRRKQETGRQLPDWEL